MQEMEKLSHLESGPAFRVNDFPVYPQNTESLDICQSRTCALYSDQA